MEQHYGEVNSGFHQEVELYDNLPNVIKVHDNIEELANKADLMFTTIRVRVGVRDSIKRINKWDDTLDPDKVEGMMIGWLWWAERADFIQTYKETHNMHKLIRRYIDFLQFDLDPQKVLNQVEREMKDPGDEHIKKHDPQTLLHHKHKSEW